MISSSCPEPAHGHPLLAPIPTEDLALGPRADVQLARIDHAAVGLRRALRAAARGPLRAALVAVHRPAVDQGIELAAIHLQAEHAVVQADVLPVFAALVLEHVAAVIAHAVQFAAVHGQVEDIVGLAGGISLRGGTLGRGAFEARVSAIDPRAARIDAKNTLPPGIVFRVSPNAEPEQL